jgi:ATP-dependent Clp protease ATP-binding subunit ClpC
MKVKVNDELKQHFRPEFLNRIDDTIVFHQLRQDEILHIADLMIERVRRLLLERGMSLRLTARARRLLADRGFDPVLGARPLRRAVQRDIEDALSEQMLFGAISSGQVVVVDVAAGADGQSGAGFVFHGESAPPEALTDQPAPVDVRQGGGTDESGNEERDE